MGNKTLKREMAAVAAQEAQLRKGWSGAFAREQLTRPGGPLMAALVQCAFERGQSIPQMAEELGYSYPYLNLLLGGLRRVDQTSDDFANACSRYLNVPRAAVLMMAGRLGPEDFFGPGELHAGRIESAMRYLEEDPAWAPLITGELRNTSVGSRFCLIKMYEAATGRRLLEDQLDPAGFGQMLERERGKSLRAMRQATAEGVAPST